MGWRFTEFVSDFEYKCSNLSAAEEQNLTGSSVASFHIGGQPTVGDRLSYKINDSNNIPAMVYTVQQSDFEIPPNAINPSQAAPTFSIALNSSSMINQVVQPYGYSSTGSMAADLFDPQYLPPYYSEVIITAPGNSGSTITAAVTGSTIFIIAQQMTQCPVQAILTNAAGAQTTYYGYCAILDALAMGMSQASLSLWLTKADVVSFRQDEVNARRHLYRTYVMQLASFLGAQSYVDHLFGGNSGGGFGSTVC